VKAVADTAEQPGLTPLEGDRALMFRHTFWAAAAHADPDVLWTALLASRASAVALAGHIHGRAATRTRTVQVPAYLTAYSGIGRTNA
jgi:hypothetical protein